MNTRGASSRHRVGLALVLVAACGHAPAGPSSDVLAVTAAAARYALDDDVPAVLREAAPVCLTVDGQAPAPEVLLQLSRASVQVSPGGLACAGPRAILLEVSDVNVRGETASAQAGVRLGTSGVLQLRRVQGQWRVLHARGQDGAGPVLSLPARPE